LSGKAADVNVILDHDFISLHAAHQINIQQTRAEPLPTTTTRYHML